MFCPECGTLAFPDPSGKIKCPNYNCGYHGTAENKVTMEDGTEIDISKVSDITVVAFNPHTGDSIQTIKAGITEIGDIYLVNKSDLDGATQLYQALVDFVGNTEDKNLILKTSVKRNKGIKELAKILKDLMKQKTKDKKDSEKLRLESELEDIILNNVHQEISTMIGNSKSFSTYLKKVQEKKIDPFEAADKLTKNFLK